MSDTMIRLQSWFSTQCDGQWEHQKGIIIETIDNPGWSVKVDLGQVPQPQTAFQAVQVDRSDADWFRCRVIDDRFEGFGGVSNLAEVIDTFLNWVGHETGPSSKNLGDGKHAP